MYYYYTHACMIQFCTSPLESPPDAAATAESSRLLNAWETISLNETVAGAGAGTGAGTAGLATVVAAAATLVAEGASTAAGALCSGGRPCDGGGAGRLSRGFACLQDCTGTQR